MISDVQTRDLVLQLRKKLLPELDSFLEEGYEGLALHTSSIIIAVNEGCANMFGYTMDEMINMNAWILFSTASREKLMEHLVAKSSEPYTVTGVRKDKTTFEVELKGNDFEVSGEPVRSVCLKVIK